MVEDLECVLERFGLEVFGLVCQCYPKLLDLVTSLLHCQVVDDDRSNLGLDLVPVELWLLGHLAEQLLQAFKLGVEARLLAFEVAYDVLDGCKHKFELLHFDPTLAEKL